MSSVISMQHKMVVLVPNPPLEGRARDAVVTVKLLIVVMVLFLLEKHVIMPHLTMVVLVPLSHRAMSAPTVLLTVRFNIVEMASFRALKLVIRGQQTMAVLVPSYLLVKLVLVVLRLVR